MLDLLNRIRSVPRKLYEKGKKAVENMPHPSFNISRPAFAALVGVAGFLYANNASAQKITFVSERDGNAEIYTMDADGKNPTKVLNNPDGGDGFPSWSPDGRYLAFSSGRKGIGGLYLYDTIDKMVSFLGSEGFAPRKVAWSPNGTRIAYAGEHGTYVMELIKTQPNGYVVGAIKKYGPGETFAWSRDGTKLAFLGDTGGITVNDFTEPDEKRSLKQLTLGWLFGGLKWIRITDWSPDGNEILFYAHTGTKVGDNADVYSVNKDSLNLRRLANHPANDGNAVYSPDGKKIYFQSYRSRELELWEMDIDGKNLKQLTTSPLYWDKPSISPDGQKIAFTAEKDGKKYVHLIESSGANEKELTEGYSPRFEQPNIVLQDTAAPQLYGESPPANSKDVPVDINFAVLAKDNSGKVSLLEFIVNDKNVTNQVITRQNQDGSTGLFYHPIDGNLPHGKTFTWTVKITDPFNNQTIGLYKITTVLPTWDVNKDGEINIFDMVTSALNLDATVPVGTNGDANKDGVVNIFDLVLQATHFGDKYDKDLASPIKDYKQLTKEQSSVLGTLEAQLYKGLQLVKSNSPESEKYLRALHEISLYRSNEMDKRSAEIKQDKLGQNYPNPFNSETWIPYQLAKDANATIRIFDSVGKQVTTLDLGYKKSGNYYGREDNNSAAYWNGKNNAGENVASGIYFYTLQAGKFISSKKMVILK